MPSHSPTGPKRPVIDPSSPSFSRDLKSNGDASDSQSSATPPSHISSHKSRRTNNRSHVAGTRIHSRNTSYGKGLNKPKIIQAEDQEQAASGKDISRTQSQMPLTSPVAH